MIELRKSLSLLIFIFQFTISLDLIKRHRHQVTVSRFIALAADPASCGVGVKPVQVQGHVDVHQITCGP